MKKEKILIVHNYYQLSGGEDRVVTNEKAMLEEHGHDVILYTRNNSEICSFGIIKKLFLPFIYLFNIKTYRDIKKVIKEKGIEIVHVHNTLSLISPAVYYAALKCGVPVVQTLHNYRMICPGAIFYRDGHICEECLEQGIIRALQHRCYRDSRIQTAVCVACTLIHRKVGIYNKINYICLTEFYKEKFLQLNKHKQYIDSRCVFIKPNFTFAPDKTRYKVDLREKNDYYLFVGRVEEIKGINLIVNGFKRMPDLKLRIAGMDNGGYKKIIESIPNIQMLGVLEPENIEKVYRGAKALIVAPQIYETFSMVIIEAYSFGKPVIAGNIGHIGSLVLENRTGLLFEYKKIDSFVRTIRKFEMLSQEKRDKLCDNAYEEYRRNYTSEINYGLLTKIYQVVSKRNGRL